ncbi:hypothetical protein JL720_7499 [Aureococcus anophagefferens]|nr:hypothetical protein JL720_7499 [Aureococcus anophagefferens]
MVGPSENFKSGACVRDYDGTSDLFPSKSESGMQFRSTVSSDYSLFWEVSYHGHYKILQNSNSGEVHVLHQCGVDAPAAEDLPDYAADATFVQVPVSNVATTSTTYIPFIEMIGERAALKAYGSSFDYVSSPCLRKMHRDGAVVSAYDSSTWSVSDEVLQDANVEVTIADSWSNSAYAAYTMTDIAEDSVLKVAEYVEVVGLFFNREAEATAAIETMIANYVCATDSAAAYLAELGGDAAKPKVCWTSYYAYASDASGGWTMAASPVWYSELIEAAGGELLMYDGDGDVVSSWGTAYMSTDQVLELCADADVIISPDVWTKSAEPFTLLDGLPAVVNGRDILAALYPESDEFGSLERKWLRDVEADEAVGGVSDDDLDAACPDVTADYVFEAATMCDSSSSSSSSSNSDIVLIVIVAAAILIALVGAVFCAVVSRNSAPPPGAKVVEAKPETEA